MIMNLEASPDAAPDEAATAQTPPPADELGAATTFEHEGCAVYAVVDGPEDAPPVIFTHGALLDHSSWRPPLRALAPDNRVMAWDLPGHGRSKPLFRFDPTSGGRALIALMDHFGVARATRVGLSVGGWIAQWVARHHPARVRALACFDTTSLTEPDLSGVARLGLRRSADLVAPLPFELVRRALPPLLARTPSARRQAYLSSRAVSREEFLIFWRGASRMLEPDPDDRTTAPLLIAHGARDLVARIPVYARRWAERTPNAHLEILKGAGHLANLDAPEAATAVLRRFLEQVERPR